MEIVAVIRRRFHQLQYKAPTPDTAILEHAYTLGDSSTRTSQPKTSLALGTGAAGSFGSLHFFFWQKHKCCTSSDFFTTKRKGSKQASLRPRLHILRPFMNVFTRGPDTIFVSGFSGTKFVLDPRQYRDSESAEFCVQTQQLRRYEDTVHFL